MYAMRWSPNQGGLQVIINVSIASETEADSGGDKRGGISEKTRAPN